MNATRSLAVGILLLVSNSCNERKPKNYEHADASIPLIVDETVVNAKLEETARIKVEKERLTKEKLELEISLRNAEAAKIAAEAEIMASQEQLDREEKLRIIQDQRKNERDRFVQIQRNALHTKFDEIELQGRKYLSAFIKAIDDEGVSISHSTGAKKIPWSEISAEYRNAWGYDPKKAEELEKEPVAAYAAKIVAVPKKSNQMRIEAERQESKKREKERVDKLRKIADLESNVAQARSEIRRLTLRKSSLDYSYYYRQGSVRPSPVVIQQKNESIDKQIRYFEHIVSKGESEIKFLKAL